MLQCLAIIREKLRRIAPVEIICPTHFVKSRAEMTYPDSPSFLNAVLYCLYVSV